MSKFINGSTVVIIGGTGTVGRKITEYVLAANPKAVRIFSRDEHKQFIMANELNHDERIRFLVGDVRDAERVMRATRGADYIFNLAALKHVPSCEYNPFEAVKTNVIGMQNVINASVENEVKRIVFTSSDKSISPTNAMGATKLLAERLIASASYSQGSSKTVFSAVRFGNVMGSRGSVIPLFVKQIIEQRKITVTNSEMSRFMMSVNDAAELSIRALNFALGGEIFVLKMPIILLGDLVEVVVEETCRKYSIPEREVEVEQIGLRPGEKMYEELMTKEEAEFSYDIGEMFAVISPFNQTQHSSTKYKGYNKAEIKSYSSKDGRIESKEWIRNLVLKLGLI